MSLYNLKIDVGLGGFSPLPDGSVSLYEPVPPQLESSPPRTALGTPWASSFFEMLIPVMKQQSLSVRSVLGCPRLLRWWLVFWCPEGPPASQRLEVDGPAAE